MPADAALRAPTWDARRSTIERRAVREASEVSGARAIRPLPALTSTALASAAMVSSSASAGPFLSRGSDECANGAAFAAPFTTSRQVSGRGTGCCVFFFRDEPKPNE